VCGTCRRLSQNIQDIFLTRSLHLLFIEHVSGAAVAGAQAQHVLAAEAGDRAFQDRGAVGPFAYFACKIRGEAAAPGGLSMRCRVC